VNREFAAGFAAAIAVIALLWERVPSRPWIALAAVTTAGFATHRANGSAAPTLDALISAPDIPLVALAGTLLFLVTARAIDDRKQTPEWMLAVVLIPALFLQAALSPFKVLAGTVPAAIVLTWGLVYSVFALMEKGQRRGILITLGGFAGLWAIMLVLDGSPDAIPPVLAAYAVLLATVSKSENQPVVLTVTGAALMLSYGIAMVHLAGHSEYTASPFLNVASLGVASAVGAAYLSARLGLPDTVALSGEHMDRGDLVTLAAATLAFAWGYLELRRAFSPDISTFLLIAYLATCGVVTIYAGRVRNESGLRQVGLSLAVVAALYAISAASDVQQIGLRVGSYLLVGAFLLGVAWWYRGEQPIIEEPS
jgi:hypothetical protein